MDIEKERRWRVVRVALIDIIMALSVVAIVVVLVLIVSGYRFNENMSLEQSGLVQVDTIPSGATVEIDGEVQSAKTEMSRMLSEGEHSIYITKDGYESWSNKIKITPGWLLRLNYIRLIKQDRKQEEIRQFTDLKYLTASPDQSRILYMTENTHELQLLEIANDVVDSRTLEFDFDLGEIQSVIWSRAGDNLVVQSVVDGQKTWMLLDLSAPERSKNLTVTWGVDLQKVLPYGEDYYALSDGNLYKINGTDYSTTGVLLEQVIDFYNYEDRIIYAAQTKQGIVLGTSVRGVQKTVYTIKDKEVNTIKTALLRDAGKEYPVYIVDNVLFIYNNENSPSLITKEEMAVTPDVIDVSWNNQILVMRNGASWTVYDIETGNYTTYDAGVTQLDWLDDYMMAGVIDNRLTVWDYDGTNRRVLSKAEAGYDAVIAENNHWIYYVAKDAKTQQLVLQRESL